MVKGRNYAVKGKIITVGEVNELLRLVQLSSWHPNRNTRCNNGPNYQLDSTLLQPITNLRLQRCTLANLNSFIPVLRNFIYTRTYFYLNKDDKATEQAPHT